MKTRVRLKGWIVPALCLVLFSGCSKSAEEAEWAATVEMVGGIKVVTNPDEPKYGEFAFDLEEDLAIGDVNDENYFFPRHVTPNVDDEGNIYVCDGGNRRVQKYDKSGKYVRTIGRQGQGPGEYTYPSRLFFDDVGILVSVTAAVSFTTLEMEIFEKKYCSRAFIPVLFLAHRERSSARRNPVHGQKEEQKHLSFR